MPKFKNLQFRKDTQRDNPILKKLAAIVKEHDCNAGLILVVDEEGIDMASYHRPGQRVKGDIIIELFDEFLTSQNVKEES